MTGVGETKLSGRQVIPQTDKSVTEKNSASFGASLSEKKMVEIHLTQHAAPTSNDSGSMRR
ncbi:MAG: hypothetical protein INR71_06650 [Terriglobus roseus]|nr:hypothetical protein [Terriglobus roseus]